jgi:hypothetical protein
LWRFSLENLHSGNRIGFQSVQDLAEFLDQSLTKKDEGTAGLEENHSCE